MERPRDEAVDERAAELQVETTDEDLEDPEVARGAPYSTPVRRLDEAGAAKRPVIRQPFD